MKDLKKKISEFNKERNWDQFHSPKNLAIGLSVEANELLEYFTWMGEEESRELPDKTVHEVCEEIGDVLIYLVNLSNKLGVDPVECAHEKLKTNDQKYPPEKAFGSCKKYDEI